MIIDDSIVLVTGSARRLGKEIALGFARRGGNVIVHYASESSRAKAESTSKEIIKNGVKSIVVKANQANEEDVKAMFRVIQNEFSRIDILVNSAAVFGHGELLNLPVEEWDRVINTNLRGPFMLTQAAAKLMVETNNAGVIINISDNSGLNGWSSRPHHSISKAGVIMLTQVAAQSLSRHNIRVNCVIPGPVLPPADGSSSVEQIAQDLPLGRIGSPENISEACIFLAENDFATGTLLRVDGGEGLIGGQL